MALWPIDCDTSGRIGPKLVATSKVLLFCYAVFTQADCPPDSPTDSPLDSPFMGRLSVVESVVVSVESSVGQFL